MADEQVVPALEETPVANDATSKEDISSTAEATAEVIDPELEVPTVYKEDEQTLATEEQQQPTPEEPSEEAPKSTEEADEEPAKARLKGAMEAVEKKNKELQRITNLQAELVQENPDTVHKIAEKDPKLADRIVNQLWGEHGIKSYKQLVERAKIEQLKESNPDLYETKRQLVEMQSKLQEREEREKKAVHEKFFKDKGITPNEYDPTYKKVNEALNLVNPALLEEDYGQALELAYNLSVTKARPAKAVQAPTLNVGGGVKAPAIPTTANNAPSEQSAWLAEGLNRLGGYKIKF